MKHNNSVYSGYGEDYDEILKFQKLGLNLAIDFILVKKADEESVELYGNTLEFLYSRIGVNIFLIEDAIIKVDFYFADDSFNKSKFYSLKSNFMYIFSEIV